MKNQRLSSNIGQLLGTDKYDFKKYTGNHGNALLCKGINPFTILDFLAILAVCNISVFMPFAISIRRPLYLIIAGQSEGKRNSIIRMKRIEESTTHTVLVSGSAFFRQNVHILWPWIGLKKYNILLLWFQVI